jgi:hypothetical protein
MFCILLFNFVNYEFLLLCLCILIVMYVLFYIFCVHCVVYILFLFKCVLYYCQRVSTHFRLTIYLINYISILGNLPKQGKFPKYQGADRHRLW